MSAAAGTSVELAGHLHRFVPGPDTRRPLLLLHGTGGDEQDLLPLGRQLAPDAPLVSPRGNVMENGMPRFFRRLAEGVFDMEDLVERTRLLAAFVDQARGAYGIGAPIAVGFSNGANIAASLLLLHPGALAGAALLRPMVPIEPDPLPDLTGVPVLIASGEADPIVPATEPTRLARVLTAAGAAVTTHSANGGHRLERSDLDAVAGWLATIGP